MVGGEAGGGGTINAAGYDRGSGLFGDGDRSTHGLIGDIGSTGGTGRTIGTTDPGGGTTGGGATHTSGA
jgi:hypothetical protein